MSFQLTSCPDFFKGGFWWQLASDLLIFLAVKSQFLSPVELYQGIVTGCDSLQLTFKMDQNS